MPEFEMKDSGERSEYETGAVRENDYGRGAFELISPFALKRLAVIYQKGSHKYPARNWEKGIPMSRVIRSALRHINDYLTGDRSEDHLACAAWNLCALIHYTSLLDMGKLPKEIDDLPKYISEDYQACPDTTE